MECELGHTLLALSTGYGKLTLITPKLKEEGNTLKYKKFRFQSKATKDNVRDLDAIFRRKQPYPERHNE